MDLIAAFEEFRLDRCNEPVLIVGGGAVLDLAGFAASIYRRGVPFVKVPTTLLAQIDAAIGVKNAVNFAKAKNLIGTFYPPKEVLMSAEFFASLPEREIFSGLGELFKLATVCDCVLFEWLERDVDEIVSCVGQLERHSEPLVRAIEMMLRELAPNLYEEQLARAVDFGHTFSQAIEMQDTSGGIRHGEAVTGDALLATAIAVNRGLLDRGEADRVLTLGAKLLNRGSFQMAPASLLWDSVTERARHRGGFQRIPVPREIGQCAFIDDLSYEEVEEALVMVMPMLDGTTIATAARW
jgi:3-dehydroquinate synthase